jgi:hypothetical protein
VVVGILHALVLLVGAAYAARVSVHNGLAALGIAIAAQMGLAYICRPFNFPQGARISWKLAAPSIALGLIAAFSLPLESAVVIVAGAALILRLATALLYHWPGGVTAWSLPAVGLIVEAFTISYMQKGGSPID